MNRRPGLLYKVKGAGDTRTARGAGTGTGGEIKMTTYEDYLAEVAAMEAANPVMQDLHKTWLPDPAAVKIAVAALKAAQAEAPEGVELLAAIPMVQPGKTHGIWTIGQTVETVPGAVFIGANTFDAPAGVADYGWARGEAVKVAQAKLGDAEGTVAYATIYDDGEAAVFEW